MTISKATELAGAGNYPQTRLRQKERKVIETAESYSPAVSGDWTTAPSTQDDALDALAAVTPLVATGSLTSAEILALNATPIELIAAPGEGKAIIVEDIQLFLDFNSAAYVADAAEDLQIKYETFATVIGSIDNDVNALLTAAADAYWYGKPQAIYDVQAAGTGDGVLLSDIDNEAVVTTINTGEVITGDSPIYYKINYKIVDLVIS